MNDSDEIRARIRAVVSIAFDVVPPVWPVGGFIPTNPLGGYEHLPFHQAVAVAQARTGARGYGSEAEYRERYGRGAISPAALDFALERAMGEVSNERRALFGRSVSVRELVRFSLCTDLARRPRRSELVAAAASRVGSWRGAQAAMATVCEPPAAHATLGELVDARCGTNIMPTIDERTIVWCAAFLDEGEASWPMPERDRGFYRAWRALAPYDGSSAARAINGYRRRLAQAFARPEDAIASALATMGVDRPGWEAHLRGHALRLPGWAGVAKWRATGFENSARQAPIDPVQYLAVRLWYEAALVSATAERHGLRPTREAFAERFGGPQAGDGVPDTGRLANVIANLAGELQFSATEVLALDDGDLAWMTGAVWAFDEQRRGRLWLEAHERHVRGGVLDAIARRAASASPTPVADVVFCIDVRSEGYRRHLEAVGPYRTRGFAGFYGLPIALRSLDSTWAQQACPVLLTPKHQIVERATGPASDIERHRQARAFVYDLGRILAEVKGNASAPFALFESIGALFAIPLAGRTLLPRLFGRLRARVARALVPEIETTFTLAKAPDDDAVGFTPAERLFFAESALALMDMRAGFARLIVLVGHGSTTENNPFEASLDCGACAGYRGGPNARILAAMLNDAAVRAGLVARGIVIPSATVFVGAEHDTTTDRVRIPAPALVPPSHRAELAALQRGLDEAGARLAAERLRALEPHSARPPSARAEGRSSDWAQVRPEWGLARNAAFVVAPRSFTFGADLGTRAFLHEYDVEGDRDGALLEIIMTAPLVVAQWINNHYYFATVDNERYGSGTKVLHNVVGRIGVMSGNRSDLRAGLPLQSLADRRGWYHEPVRLLAVVMAPRARIEAVVARNTILRRLFHHEWIALTAWDPDTNQFWDYTPQATWRPHAGRTATLPLTASLS